jgi:hypothetical protein
MSHHDFSNILNNIHKAPNSCKIMASLLFKNICYGFYTGIQKMNQKERPITYIYESMVVYGMWDVLKHFFGQLLFHILF